MTERWETEFWSYLSAGDGTNCPIFDACKLRIEGFACSCPSFGNDWMELSCIDSISGCTGAARRCRLSKLLSLLTRKCLKEGEVRAAPVPESLIYLMDKDCAIEIRYLPMKTYGGAVWKVKDSWIVYLNSNESVERQRLSVFHEAFHILAHCQATPVFKKPGEARGSFNEMLADNFALHLLMPEDWVRDRWLNSRSVAAVAREFNVTEKAVGARLKTLGLV